MVVGVLVGVAALSVASSWLQMIYIVEYVTMVVKIV